MSRVITFSTKFPAYHPKKGNPTHFVEKIFAGLADILEGWKMPKDFVDYDWHTYYNCHNRKFHTIRKGNRWKVGDKFSPRIWGTDINPKSGRSGAYHSKQIIFSPDIEIKKIWSIKIELADIGNGDKAMWIYIDGKFYGTSKTGAIADADGLKEYDFEKWFNKLPFEGQILCWNENINY